MRKTVCVASMASLHNTSDAENKTGVTELRTAMEVRPKRSFWNVLIGIPPHAQLIRLLAADELRRHYVGSMLGALWLVVKPLLVVSVYIVLFGVVFRARVGPAHAPMEYALVLLAGLLPWLIFAESLTAATGSVASKGGLATKVRFPIEILPIATVLASTLSGLVGLCLFLLALAVLKPFGGALLLLPLLLAAQLLFTLGLAWTLSAFNVVVRDVSQILPLAMTGWLFLSPVVYTAEMVPEPLARAFALNPMAYFLDSYRAILLANQPPTIHQCGVIGLVAVGTFLAGCWIFDRLRGTIAECL
ncbi:MAG: ABC transporter permease [Nitrospira sp.]|nr:ABC transporter permease [Nitrospira sp.]